MLWQCTRGAKRPIQGFTTDAIQALKGHSWPGNVRELRNVIERAVMLARGHQVEPDDIVFSRFKPDDEQESLECQSIEEMEKNLIRRVLEANDWHRTKSADVLGINRTTLWQKIKRYGLAK
jgi:DNA-binding NtrC family response regulator